MEALAVTPHGHPDRAERHYELGIRLADLYELTGRIDDLSNAISLCLKAVANTPEDHPNRAGWLSELGIRLADRHHHTGYIDDLINEDGVSTLDENVLYAASFRGYEKLVQILLDKGVNVNAQGGEYGNALQAASHLGYEKVVQILLEKGADVNAQGGEYGNALYAASSEGHINVVQTLLSNGANINAQGGRFNNALYAASSGGHIEVAQMLLDNGADVNAQGGFYGNALQAASAEGHIEVVQMLLDKGANTNARGRFKNALQAALAEGHTEVAQMLFDKSGDVNAQGGEYGNSLERTEEILKDVESPPFLSQENFGEIVSGEGQAVTPHIKCKIEKGFFFSSDRTWTTYRRNYFSVNCSYTLDPYFPHGRLYLSRRNRNAPEQIQAIAMTLSAAIDGAAGKSIELVQHTPKRHKGPQLQIQMERLLPIPPSREETIAPPFLPFQEPYSPIDLSVTSHQHTFERIQFKSATANNGKGRAQQQYCHLFIELYADVRRTFEDLPEWVRVARRMSAPLVVRGRSPSHYEGPHSAGHSISNNLTMPGSSAMGSAVDRADPDLPPQPDPSRDPVDRRTPEDTMGGSLAAMRADDVKE
ncbi:putative ndt80 like dna-binding family protein [Lasiodiplodia theobromae]|nr:putative ndt80 like dna-binding family protein [Lasiodiplodia theobromae]